MSLALSGFFSWLCRLVRHPRLRSGALASLLLASPLAQAFTVTAFSPQGEVSRVRQVTAKFSEAMVAFGAPKAPAPVTLRCDNAAASRGQGRWTSAREWVYDFEADLPPGVNCRADAVPGFKSDGGGSWSGPVSHAFRTGGPFVQRIVPGPSEQIEEEQAFAIRLNGDATSESLAAHLWCAVDGLGERVPVRPLAAEARVALYKQQGWDKDAERAPLRHAAFQCNRRLTPSGVANRVERRFAFQVREPFTASFSCERENAQAACMPIRPLEVRFSAPVPRRLAALVRLRGDRVEHEPIIDGIRKVKRKYGHYSLSDLLYYVYTKYPDMTTESEIKDKVLGKRK
jgi:hypothetical protein